MSLRDLQFGAAAQAEVLPLIREFFGEDIRPTPGKFDRYDYESSTAVYELKARRNPKDQYPTTCIGSDKIDPKHPKQQVYLFHFTDGTYYIRYDSDVFATFVSKLFARSRPGVNDKPKLYTYISVDKLLPIPRDATPPPSSHP